MMLAPYIGTRAVTREQIAAAVSAGLTIEQIEDRLIDAECELAFAFDHEAWKAGWRQGVNAIRWLESDANTDDIGVADLLADARELQQRQRREHYRQVLTEAPASLDVARYSNTLGRIDCCRSAMQFVDVNTGDWLEIAEIVASSSDRQDLQAIATERRVERYLSTRHRIPALMNVLAGFQEMRGAM